MAGTVWMFPGQGSQRPEMAAGLGECRELFSAAEAIVDHDLERLCTVDPDPAWSAESLQPGLFITCCGAAKALLAAGRRPDAVVGHSLGEFAALFAAGALEFEEALRVVSIRAGAMAAAARAHPGGMAAVVGLDRAAVEKIVGAVDGVWVANLNSPQQTVISGQDAAVAAAAGQLVKAGARKVVRLDVPIAGHSPLMAAAAAEVKAALDAAEMKPPSYAFYSVADALPHSDPVQIKESLVAAVTSPVRFTDTLAAMQRDGYEEFIEVGPGSVLGGLVKRTLENVSIGSVGADAQALPEQSRVSAAV